VLECTAPVLSCYKEVTNVRNVPFAGCKCFGTSVIFIVSLNNDDNNDNIITAIGLSPGGSGCFACVQNMKLVTNKFKDRLCGLVVRVSGYRSRGPGFDPRRYQIF